MSGIRTYVQTDMRVAPTQDNHLVRLRDMIEYVNALISEAVRVVATFPLALDDNALPIIVDGVEIAEGDRILVAGQLDRTTNGIYIFHSEGMVRDNNFNSTINITPGMIVPVLEGDTYGGTRWRTVLGGVPFVIGVVNIDFQQEIVDFSKVVEMTFDISGDENSMEYDITHGLRTKHVTHELFNEDGETVVGGFRRLNANIVRVTFGVPLGVGNDLTLIIKAEVDPT